MNSQITLHSERGWADTPWEHRWDHLSYRVRVRSNATVALWGSLQITQPITLPQALLFHIRNDQSGEPVAIGSQAGSTQTQYGVLQPGGCITIPVQTMSAVTALCENNTTTTVHCCIRTS
jgi:hypothetical protein